MQTDKVLKGLEQALGASPKKKQLFDPELFLIRFKGVIVDQQKELNRLVEKLQSTSIDKMNAVAKQLLDQQADTVRLQKILDELTVAIKEHSHEPMRVEVEKSVVVPAPVVNVQRETQEEKDEQRGWWTKAFELFKAPADNLMATFERMRTDPQYAIGVKLTTANGESFYNAVMTAVSGGMSTAGLATETTLSAINTKLAGSIAVTGTFWQTTQPVKQVALPMVTNTTSTLTLTSANTAYQITIPSSDYLVTFCNASDTDMYWGFATLTSGGILLAKSGGTITFLCSANKAPFFTCASAGKVLNYTTTVL